jgi:hypothetical protein
LFVLYAEDRYLLPVNEQPYKGYSLRYAVRLPVEEILDQGLRPSETASRFYASAKYLFRAIDEGDEALRLPPYNGRLFEARRAPILERTSLPDGVFADIVNRLSRLDIGLFKRRINYRDLSVRQLGSIYERLLEYDAVLEDGEIKVRLQPFARKDSGSYYTPDELVRLIIEKTVGPLVDERWQAFVVRIEELRGQKRPKVERLDSLAEVDPAMAMLDLKVCDPAMGSGHFLVALVDYLADQILEALARCSPAVDWADKSAPYVSPLIRRLENLRTHIRDRATSKRWRIPEEQLDDRHLIRRIILKRVVYGVDMNPMAVELAKVSLWLHTFTVGAPLSFLDHHLRCGNSLFGERVRQVIRELSKQFTLLINPLVKQAQNAEAGLRRIAEIADADLAEVKESKETFEEAEQETAALRALLDVRQGLRWLGVHNFETPRLHPSMLALFDGSLGDPRNLLTSNLLRSQADEAQPSIKITRPRGRNREPQPITQDELRLNAARALARARERADEQVFLHWEVAFPDVWTNWESSEPHGGFDAIIGNPPWDRLKMQEVEWFTSHRLDIAMQQRASDRARMIGELKDKGDPLAAEYERARLASEEAVAVA